MPAQKGQPDLRAAAETHAAEGVARSDATATNSARNRELYRARVPIHPKLVHGRFRAVKWIALVLALGIYYLLPWIRWERGPGLPDQAVLIDLARERFYFFFIEIWPQEVYYVTGLLILAALGLFLVTALFGRVWCGYACPQTVWTDLFIVVERLFEGDRNARIRLDASPWTVSKLLRKAGKHVVWLLIAAATGGAWILYFHDAPTLARTLFAGTADLSAYVFLGTLTFTTYALAGMMREQVCTYMCPWPRIQAALVDEETLQVTYRRDRGEPRGFHKKGQSWDGRGDCIDCHQCVAACPMGIDIREGAQLECINCALCIDACDDVMRRVGRPTRLIFYDTDLNLARRQAGERGRFRPFRARTVLYSVVILMVIGLMAFGLSTRSSLDLNVLRDRNPNFVVLSDGRIRNAYTVKVFNRADQPRDLTLAVEGPAGLEVQAIGLTTSERAITVPVAADESRAIRVLLTLPLAERDGLLHPVRFLLRADESGDRLVNDQVFIPGSAP